MDNKALYNLSYGVYLLTANENGRDNGCIINTAVQVANDPARISISVIKGNLTCDMILNTHKFNLSSITESADFIRVCKVKNIQAAAYLKKDEYQKAKKNEYFYRIVNKKLNTATDSPRHIKSKSGEQCSDQLV